MKKLLIALLLWPVLALSANKTINQLTEATSLASGDEFELQLSGGGASRKVTFTNLQNYVLTTGIDHTTAAPDTAVDARLIVLTKDSGWTPSPGTISPNLGDWRISTGTSDFASQTYSDPVMFVGYNIQNGGKTNSSEHAMGLGWEADYYTNGKQTSEFYLQHNTRGSGTNGVSRPIFITMDNDTFVYPITAITKAASAVVTVTGTPKVQVNDWAYVASIGGMTELNQNYYLVTGVSGSNVTLQVNSTGFTTYTSGGTLERATGPVLSAQYQAGGFQGSNGFTVTSATWGTDQSTQDLFKVARNSFMLYYMNTRTSGQAGSALTSQASFQINPQGNSIFLNLGTSSAATVGLYATPIGGSAASAMSLGQDSSFSSPLTNQQILGVYTGAASNGTEGLVLIADSTTSGSYNSADLMQVRSNTAGTTQDEWAFSSAGVLKLPSGSNQYGTGSSTITPTWTNKRGSNTGAAPIAWVDIDVGGVVGVIPVWQKN